MSGLTKDGLTVTFTASASAGEVVNQSFVNGDMGDSPEDPLIPTTWSYFWGFFLAGRFGPFKSGSKPPNPMVERHHFSADMAFFYWSKSANPHFSRKSDGWAWYHLIPTAGGGTRKPYDIWLSNPYDLRRICIVWGVLGSLAHMAGQNLGTRNSMGGFSHSFFGDSFPEGSEKHV